MRSSALFVHFTLFAVATAFTIYDKISEQGRNDSLNLAENKDCKCLNGRCVYRREKWRCLCHPRHSNTDEETCQPCDCGKLGTCIFELTLKSASAVTYVKKCICNKGSAVKDGICVDCNCGENSACEFDGDEKSCFCLQGYAVKDGVCKECNCGDNGECTFVSGVKECSCFEGFVLKNGICEECDCGEYGFCSFIDGVKTCKCSDGYEENDGFCEECKCGENSYGCEYENGEKKCLCRAGYLQKDGICAVDICFEKCGTAHGVVCYGDRTEEVTCGCDDENKAFVNSHKECRDCNCGENSYGCSFGYEGKSCKCNEGFVQKKGICEVGCGVHRGCENGGLCKEGHCDCFHGTYGEFCELFPDCDPSCSEDADCIYDITVQLPDCVCRDKERGFNPRTKTCARKCHEDSMCKNGGICSGFQKYSLCECLSGTSGDICEEVDECVMDKDKCKDGAACIYDIANRNAVCRCSSPEERYDEQTERCKRTCGEGNNCYNGGKCDGTFCDCLPGTSGHHCEKVDECETNMEKCKDGAKCVYDISEGKASCRCPGDGRRYDPQSERCRETCDGTSRDCKNGGECDYNNFCKCLLGTSGDFCEKIDKCPTCEDDAYCVFDVKDGIAKCMCKEYGKSYDSMTDRCRETCDRVSHVCKNGGECDYYNFCKCLPGTSGDFCEKIDDCPKCTDDAYCVFDAKERRAKCTCKEDWKFYDSTSDRCRETCISDSMCENGGKCHQRFCKCLKGTSGDFCKDVDECTYGLCGYARDVRCLYDVERQVAKCECGSSDIFDPVTKRCRKTCISDSMCENGGKCHQRFCMCLIGTSGDFCKDVDECMYGLCGYGRDVRCLYDVERQVAKCDCGSSSNIFDPETKTCRTCDCGENAISCAFSGGKKICHCSDGFTERDGTCEKKGCTEKSCFGGKCEIIKGQEVCKCFEGYVPDGDYCRKLNCTKTPCINGTCVVRHGRIEECICPAGFTLDRDVCKRGSCRMTTCYGGRCETIDGELTCVCPKGFHLEGIGCYETVCKIHRCFGGKCVVKDKQEICTCREGYILRNDVCKKILCEKKSCFGGQCHIVDGQEVCTCPTGFSIFEDVCRADRIY